MTVRAAGRAGVVGFAVRTLAVAFTLAATVTVATVAAAQPPEAVRGRHGMVVSDAPLASTAGADVLARGGNAVDAAVATAFALAVVEPTMSGLGGRTQLLLRTPDGAVHGIDGTTTVPAAYPTGGTPADDDAYGWRTVAVPGTVAALAAALDAHGTWTLADVLAPAIRLAEDGFTLPAAEAARIAAIAERLRASPGAARHFLRPEGTAFAAGERFVQPDLARVLRAIAADGPDAFYRGDIARRMAADAEANGGWLRYEDLAGYRAEPALLVRGSYRGHELVGTYLPASGATTIQALHILENFDVAGRTGTAVWASLLAQSLALAFDERAAALAGGGIGAAELVSKERARALARRIRTEAPAVRGGADAREPAHTTHLSVVDARGGIVALTQSVGPVLGAKVATPGLGFVYAATMGYLGDLVAGDRPMSSQSPLIVLRDGAPILVLGGAGARRIVSAVVATVSRVIDQRLPLPDAMAAPRLHTTAGRIDVEVHDGAAWPAAELAALRALGFDVRERDEPPYFARLNAIAWDADGTAVGVADPRWTGTAVAAPARADGTDAAVSTEPLLSRGHGPGSTDGRKGWQARRGSRSGRSHSNSRPETSRGRRTSMPS